MLAQVIEAYLQEYPEQLSAVERSVTMRDPVALATSAHKLKGAIGIFDTDRAFEAAHGLECAGSTGNLELVEETYQCLEIEVERLGDALRRLLLDGPPSSQHV